MFILGLFRSKKWMGGQIIYICISESREVWGPQAGCFRVENKFFAFFY